MQICVHFDSARLFRWHLVLLEVLESEGHEAVVSFVDDPEPLPTSLTVLFDYDRARGRVTDDRLSTHLAPEAFATLPRYAGGSYDVMLDVSSASHVRTHPGRVLRPLYDGSYKDHALFHALLNGRAPRLDVADSQSRDHVWPIGRPAVEFPWKLSSSFDMAASRLVEGLVRTAALVAKGESASGDAGRRSTAGRSNILTDTALFAARRIRRKALRAVDLLTANTPKWHVAWRHHRGGEAAAFPAKLSLSQFRTLDDGGNSYFADPFIFTQGDAVHVFVEEVPDKTGRGVISHFTLATDGTPGAITCVLDTGSHLSYPYVFEHEGAHYMLPESSAAGGLDLYRATVFPGQWEKVARLIDAPVHDATLFQHEGRWWIAAGTTSLQSSSWDGLSLFYADDVLGPWRAHALNPVLIDAAAARPAGPLWRDASGHLLRPAQDCTQGYGGALTVRRILQLDPETFREETAGSISFGPQSRLSGPHTIAHGGGFEIIDLYGQPSGLRSGYRA